MEHSSGSASGKQGIRVWIGAVCISASDISCRQGKDCLWLCLLSKCSYWTVACSNCYKQILEVLLLTHIEPHHILYMQLQLGKPHSDVLKNASAVTSNHYIGSNHYFGQWSNFPGEPVAEAWHWTNVLQLQSQVLWSVRKSYWIQHDSLLNKFAENSATKSFAKQTTKMLYFQHQRKATITFSLLTVVAYYSQQK